MNNENRLKKGKRKKVKLRRFWTEENNITISWIDRNLTVGLQHLEVE